MKCSFKFFSSGWYNLPNTKKGKQLSEKWVHTTLGEMRRCNNPLLRQTAKTIRKHIDEGIIRVKLNMLSPKGINRWNTYDTYVLQPES